ncbi:MAG: hypothetical protein IT289_09065 [Oligoflexia bacterium]|nr:hypothetical protein [Oligoflexia bacterium]
MMLKWILALIVLAFSPSLLVAQEIKPFFRGVRSQAMGGAGIGIVNDESALWINPAGLGKIRGPYFALVNAELEANYDTNVAISGNLTSGLTLQGLLNMARQNPQKPLHLKIQTLPTFITTNFAIGAYANYTADGEYNPTTNIFQLDYTNDYALGIGYCLRLWEGRIKIAATGKLINRVYVSQPVNGAMTNLEASTFASEGTGAGWDGALMLSAPVAWLPSVTAVAHDIGKTKFNLGSGYFFKPATRPPDINQSIDVALSVFPILSNKVRSSFTVEYRDVQNQERQDIYRRIHAGAEFNINDTFYLRGGMNQRYYTAGIELAILRQQIQVSTYGEEIGVYPNIREDRRFIVQYGLRF